jgi:glycosyltransferase involved in cell wall biosynthesis
MSLVSVVVPVYNVESYLSACVESLLAQTHQDIEIVLVNDGSTDGSAALCEAFATAHQRVTTLHKTNGGLSEARNAGLASARGAYVMFLDSDDWIEADAVARMLDLANEQHAEVVVAGYFVDVEDGMGRLLASDVRVPPRRTMPVKFAGNRDELETANLLNYVGYAWNKLYSRSLLQRVEGFPVGVSLVEDIAFNGPALAAAQRVTFLDEAFVHYMHRPRNTLGSTHYPDLRRLVALATRSTELLLTAWRVSEDARRWILNDVEQARYRYGLVIAFRARRPRAVWGVLRQTATASNGRKAIGLAVREFARRVLPNFAFRR